MSKSRSDFLGIGYFVSPWPLIAVGVLAFNDHVLKRHYPSFLTGKLSDLAGVFFFPLFLCAGVNLARNLRRRCESAWISYRQLVVALLATDVIFCAVKYWPAGRAAYLAAIAALGFPSRVFPDPTDLFAMVIANLLTLVYVSRCVRAPE